MTPERRVVVHSWPEAETQKACKSHFRVVACAPVSQGQPGHRAGDRRLATPVALSCRMRPVRRDLLAREGAGYDFVESREPEGRRTRRPNRSKEDCVCRSALERRRCRLSAPWRLAAPPASLFLLRLRGQLPDCAAPLPRCAAAQFGGKPLLGDSPTRAFLHGVSPGAVAQPGLPERPSCCRRDR
jgi:hypothetical protein